MHGTVYVSGELRLFIVSIGAYASLEVKVNEQARLPNQDRGALQLYVHGKACGKVSFFFFDVEGCVEITIASPHPAAVADATTGGKGFAEEPLPRTGPPAPASTKALT